MKGLFKDFMSNKALFFDLFDKAAKNIVDMSRLLATAVNNNVAAERAGVFEQVAKMGNNGDEVTHKINLWLDQIIFPPLNRNDTHSLAAAINDIADTIKEASARMALYDLDVFDPATKQIAEIILQASLAIERAIILLRTSKKSNQLHEICHIIKNYKRQAEQVYYHALAGLFDSEKDAVSLIKRREILLSMEAPVTKCKYTADALNVILISSI